MQPFKISIIGSGGTGAQTAETLQQKGYREIVLIDMLNDLAEATALDIQQSGVLHGSDSHLIGGSDIELTRDSDIVIITAGQGRKPGISREELLTVNAKIVEQIASQSAKLSPSAKLIVLTNPADLLTRIAFQASGFPSQRVLGQGGILDSARMATFVAQKLGLSIQDVRAMVLGGHGDHMVPMREFVSIHGIPAKLLLTNVQWEEIVHRTRHGGGEILGKFKSHGAAVTPGFALAHMVDALTSSVPRLLPVSVKSDGAYGLPVNVFAGLPALVSNRGVEKILDLPLTEEEFEDLHRSAQALEKAWNAFLYLQRN